MPPTSGPTLTAAEVERARARLPEGVTVEARAWFERVMTLRSTGDEREAFEVYCCNDAEGKAVAVKEVCTGCGWVRPITDELVVHGLDCLSLAGRLRSSDKRQGIE